jgi:hypothetical protein
VVIYAIGSRISIGGSSSSKKLLSAAGTKLASGARVTGELLSSAGDGARQIMKQAGAVLPKFLDGQTPIRQASMGGQEVTVAKAKFRRKQVVQHGNGGWIHAVYHSLSTACRSCVLVACLCMMSALVISCSVSALFPA